MIIEKYIKCIDLIMWELLGITMNGPKTLNITFLVDTTTHSCYKIKSFMYVP